RGRPQPVARVRGPRRAQPGSVKDHHEDLLNGQAGRRGALDRLMSRATTDLILLVLPILLAVWFWPGRPAVRATNQGLVVAAVLATVAALAIGQLIGMRYPEARPFARDPDTRLLIDHAADSGLPSDHALVSFAVAGTMLWWRRLTGAVLLALAACIGLARVHVGVHWPGDIAAGAMVGLVLGAALARGVPYLTGPQRWASRALPPHLPGAPGPSPGPARRSAAAPERRCEASPQTACACR